MEGLQLAPGHSFLNLGSGTGYLSTMAGLIIGPYGINHGVELHADVVKYGLERLEEFKRVSSAIDAFTFCDPLFVQGNCLCLPPDMRLYDRVYCGASCPETHEQYMKALVKPGGVLVMPINDQLVKMTRSGPNTWENLFLLPVSFSSLVMPDPNHPPATVTLPVVELPDLQDMCRQELRSLLRANIEHEHPDLVTAANRPMHKRSRPRDRRQIRRVVVPYVPVPFYESDDDPRMISDDENDNLIDAQHHTNQFSTFIELARNLAGQRRLEREREENEARQNREERGPDTELEDGEEEKKDDAHTSSNDSEIVESCDAATELGKSAKQVISVKEKVSKDVEEVVPENPQNGEEPIPSVATMPHSDPIPMTSTPVMPVKSNKKREKFDSGVGDEIENGKGPSSESDQGDDGDIDMDIDSTDSDYSDNSAPRTKVTRLLDADDPSCPCGGNCSESFKTRRGDDPEDNEEGDSCKRVSAAETYSTYMREKIGLLPLPHALKLYLNYNREL
ncbi:uncharacterized protein [Cherax quadricarinatus]|nr:uncharacterized protein LOC128701744 isoform X2 [Cherax quadricarinatus]